LDREVSTKFWKSSGSGLQIHTGFALAEVCSLHYLLFVCATVTYFNHLECSLQHILHIAYRYAMC